MTLIDMVQGLIVAAVVWIFKEVYDIKNIVSGIKEREVFIDKQINDNDARVAETRGEMKALERELQSLREAIIELNSTLKRHKD